MSLHCGKLSFILLVLQILIQTVHIECRPNPEPKPGFFGSMIGSAAGSVIGKMINGRKSKDHHQHYQEIPPTTIERRETLANGCYKQVVKEADTYSPNRYYETEQMICPPIAQPQAPGMMPGQFNGTAAMSPMYPAVNPQQVTVLSRRIGYYNSGNRLLNSSVIALITLALLVHFI